MAKPNDFTEIPIVDHKPRLSPYSAKNCFTSFLDKSFSILHVNVRSFNKKMPQLEILLTQLQINFSCIIVSETWFSENQFLNSYYLDDYNLYCRSRIDGGGGGVCVYVLKELETRVVDVRLMGSEAMLVRMFDLGRPVCSVLAVYRAPSGCWRGFLESLGALAPSLPSNTVIAGDLNFDLNSDNDIDTPSLEYLRVMSSNGFYNIIHSPTRYGQTKTSLLDHMFVNNIGAQMCSGTIDSDILADHLPIIGFFQFGSSMVLKQDKTKVISKLDHSLLSNKINEPECWNAVYACTEPDEAFEVFTSTFQKRLSEATANKTIKLNKKQAFKQPWMNNKILKLIKNREKFRSSSFQHPFNKKIHEKYIKFRNAVTFETRKAKSEYYQRQYDNCKENQNEKWCFVNRVLKKSSKADTDPTFLEVDDRKIASPKELAENFNNYFSSIGKGLTENLPQPITDFRSFLKVDESGVPFEFTAISSDHTLDVIRSMSGKKAIGYDGIPMQIIKENDLILSPVITHMINLVIKCSTFPDKQKIARVKPLHKKGDRFNVNNYRPISILTSISKITEKILTFQIRCHLELNNLLTDCQFGFRESRSTTLAISRLMEKLYHNFNNAEITQGIFIDFTKAFDTIDHNILLQKLPYYNFRPSACQLLSSYLSDRKQFVKIKDQASGMKNISIGVPQGSVLGPVLFLIFINDLINSAPKLEYILFADDTNIFSNNPRFLNSEFQKIVDWCTANRIILNCSKTFQTIFKSPNRQLPNQDDYIVNLNNSELATIDSTKFLGIELDCNITFKKHIAQVCKKLNYVILLMRAVRSYLDEKMMVNIYYSFFYPHLIYGLEFWGHAADCYLDEVYLLQKTALRIILKIPPRGHVTSQFEILKIMPIKMLFKYRFLILYMICTSSGEIIPDRPQKFYNTRSKLDVLPTKSSNCRGERSLLTKGVCLYNRYLMGEEASVPPGFRGRLAGALWGSGA